MRLPPGTMTTKYHYNADREESAEVEIESSWMMDEDYNTIPGTDKEYITLTIYDSRDNATLCMEPEEARCLASILLKWASIYEDRHTNENT